MRASFSFQQIGKRAVPISAYVPYRVSRVNGKICSALYSDGRFARRSRAYLMSRDLSSCRHHPRIYIHSPSARAWSIACTHTCGIDFPPSLPQQFVSTTLHHVSRAFYLLHGFTIAGNNSLDAASVRGSSMPSNEVSSRYLCFSH